LYFRNSPLKFNMKKTTTTLCRRYSSPCGELILGSTEGKLCLCNWVGNEKCERRLVRLLGAHFEQGSCEVTDEAARQLDEYFAGRRTEFSVPLLVAGSDFQKDVWNALGEIPYGATLSYGALAERLGASRAVRAVAGACGANAISIFLPCHRVIGSAGSLGGYAGGLPAKQTLLELEKSNS
jgi:methylated-DNA-[protein]-cysteine S-methyltransferase